jgi:hypothetical protein
MLLLDESPLLCLECGCFCFLLLLFKWAAESLLGAAPEGFPGITELFERL